MKHALRYEVFEPSHMAEDRSDMVVCLSNNMGATLRHGDLSHKAQLMADTLEARVLAYERLAASGQPTAFFDLAVRHNAHAWRYERLASTVGEQLQHELEIQAAQEVIMTGNSAGALDIVQLMLSNTIDPNSVRAIALGDPLGMRAQRWLPMFWGWVQHQGKENGRPTDHRNNNPGPAISTGTAIRNAIAEIWVYGGIRHEDMTLNGLKQIIGSSELSHAKVGLWLPEHTFTTTPEGRDALARGLQRPHRPAPVVVELFPKHYHSMLDDPTVHAGMVNEANALLHVA